MTRATVTSKYPQQQKQQQKQQQHQQQQQQPQQQQLWQSLSMYSQLVVAPATQVEVAHEVASARQLFYPKERPMAVEGVVLEGGDFLHLIVSQYGGKCRTVHISADACGLEHGATPSLPCKNVVLCFADDALLSSKIGRRWFRPFQNPIQQLFNPFSDTHSFDAEKQCYMTCGRQNLFPVERAQIKRILCHHS